MKKYILILILGLQVTSCTFPSYIYVDRKMETGLDFSNGKWLLNTVEAPYDIDKKLTKTVIADFSKHLGNRLNYVPTTKGLLLPNNNTYLNLSKTRIKELKLGTGFDYFINVRAAVEKNNMGVIELTSHRFNNDSENVVLVTVEVYDLNQTTIIYSSTIKGTIGNASSSSDFYLSKPNGSIIMSAYKKIIKDINKKSI